MTTASTSPALPATAAALADHARQAAALAEQFRNQPSRESLDAFLATSRGATMAALRAARMLRGDPLPPTPGEPPARSRRAA